MSHPEQFAFIRNLVLANAPLLAQSRVLEVGSYDVNGTVRDLFTSAGTTDYVGVDLVEGPGVDRVMAGHDVDEPDGSYDFSVSAECFEHDPDWQKTFENMTRLARPGGLVAFTCASAGRVEHGTRRTVVRHSPGTQAEGIDHYRNLAAADFTSAINLDRLFAEWRFYTCRSNFDLYFAGVRAGEGEPSGRLPDPDAVAKIEQLMPLPARAVRLPLRAMRLATRSESSYQRIAVPYWLSMMRLAYRLGLTDESGIN